jgi:hypothetical protein
MAEPWSSLLDIIDLTPPIAAPEANLHAHRMTG